MGDYTAGAAVIVADYDALRQYLIRNYAGGFRVSFRPEFGRERDQLDRLCKLLILLQYGYGFNHYAQVTLVVDELDEGFPSGIMQAMPKHGFGYLCKRGRHFGVNLLGLSQRTAQVDVVFRGNLSGCYFFRQADPIDLEKSIQMLGRDYAAELRGLNNFDYIYKSGGGVLVRKGGRQ